MSAIFDIFCTAGFLCYFGLAEHSPIRGGIDISWGVELHENELYGPIVANAYELEEKIALYPRVVVSDRVVNYLNAIMGQADMTKPNDVLNATLANICTDMLFRDFDGHHSIDYLGEKFSHVFSEPDTRSVTYNHAITFVSSQFEKFSKDRNSKLMLRYKWLLEYFRSRSIPDQES